MLWLLAAVLAAVTIELTTIAISLHLDHRDERNRNEKPR